MEIQIKPEDIDVYVKEAIIKSSLGEPLIDAINKSIKDAFNSHNSTNIFHEAARSVCHKIIMEILSSDEYVMKFKNEIEKQFTEEFLVSVVKKRILDKFY